MTDRMKIIERFQIPEVAWDIIEEILLPEEIHVIENLKADIFRPSDLTELGYSREEAMKLLIKGHARGVFKLPLEELGESALIYQLGDFYGRLDIFAAMEDHRYNNLSKEKQEVLDSWYFDTYFSALDFSDGYPTEDRVLSLEDTLNFIEKRDDQPYLAHCDCRKLKQSCDMPTLTCITYRTAPNSFVGRGHARSISKEEAKQIVRQADETGLIHTVNPGGICNCCGDCCYLFRSAERQDSFGVWPRTPGRISIDEERCIGCGKCVPRCHFQSLALQQKKAHLINRKCVGCGLCISVCPVGALSTEKLNN